MFDNRCTFTERQCILAQDSRKIKDFLANANITTFATVQDILSDLDKINTLKFKHVPAKSSRILQAFEESPSFDGSFDFLSVIRKLNYLAHTTRPDIMHAVHSIAKYTINPKHEHGEAIQHLGMYLNKTRDIGLKSTHDTSNGFEDYRDADLCGERIDESMTPRSISCRAVKNRDANLWGERIDESVTPRLISYRAMKNRDTDFWGERIDDLPSTAYHPPLKDHHTTRLSVTWGEVTANKIDPTYGYGEVIMTTSYSVEQCPTHMKGEYYSLHILCAPSPIKKFCKFRTTKNRRIIMSLTRRQMKIILSRKIGEQLSQENGEHLSSPIKKVRITKNERSIMSLPRRQMRSILSRQMGSNSRRRMGSNSRNYLNRD